MKETMLTIKKKKLQDQEFPNELFLITRQTNKIRNIIVNNMSTHITLNNAQMSKKKIQLRGSCGSYLVNLGKKDLEILLFL